MVKENINTEFIKLDETNIVEWKKELDSLNKDLVPESHKYSDCLSDDEWLNSYNGMTPQEARDLDLSYSE